ncbi:MAG: hypothetical protein JRJ21_07240, partial [Deltaproteobacteria bacterium]|nr:hypothetical protein [Deltaproteobacteria bacterium]
PGINGQCVQILVEMEKDGQIAECKEKDHVQGKKLPCEQAFRPGHG